MSIRGEDLSTILSENNIKINEVEAYTNKPSSIEIDKQAKGVLFYSPSTIISYLSKNKTDKIAYCIGETTANEARKHFEDVRVAKIPDIDSLISLVNTDYPESK